MIISRSTIFLPILILFTTFFSAATAAGKDQRTSREEYIERYKHIAIEHQKEYGIPASITMAQGILESDSGNSTLAKGSNNHFGIKCKSNWTGKTFTHTDDAPDECFRAYNSVEESYEDHAKFLDESPRYDSLFDFRSDDYRSWARGLKLAGYATAPHYTDLLIKLIEDNKLYQLDSRDGARKFAANKHSVDRAHDVKRVSMSPNDLVVNLYAQNGYDVRSANRSLYVVANEGDSYSAIAKLFGIAAGRLRSINDVDSKIDELVAGSVVYLERKATKWSGDDLVYELQDGETLRDVAQLFGVREQSLRRMSKIKRDAEVESGVTIRLK